MEQEKILHSYENAVEREKFDIVPIFEEIILEYSPKMAHSGQKILKNFSKNEYIFAHPASFSQILHNIFSNFCKYAGKNTTLNCSIIREKNMTILTFADDGVGMKCEEIPLAKEKFFRADTGRNQSGELSMGIGLSIVDRIMVAHNGFMEIAHNSPK